MRYLALGLVVALLVWGMAVEPRLLLDVQNETVPIEQLPDEWIGARIAALGDFQTGMWWDNEAMVRRATERAMEDASAAILLLGDFVYEAAGNPETKVSQIEQLLQPLASSEVPVFAVLGNHDWGLKSSVGNGGDLDPETGEAVRAMLNRLGITLLHNESRPIRLRPGGTDLHVVGIGSHWADRDQAGRALSGVPEGAPRVVLMHHPDSFEDLPAGEAPLAVAGHTHGGQIRLPLTPEWSWIGFIREDEVHADGWIRDYGEAGNRLYVNRGIGFSLAPIRLNSPPEVTVFTLVRSGAPTD